MANSGRSASRSAGTRPGLLARSLPLRSRTLRAGLVLAVLGGAAALYARTQDTEAGLLTRGGPAALRVGVSLFAGYLVGWLFRRVRMAALGLLALLVAGALALRHLGILDDPGLDSGLRDAADQALEGASRLKELAYGFLPSSFAAGAGGLAGYLSNRSPSTDEEQSAPPESRT